MVGLPAFHSDPIATSHSARRGDGAKVGKMQRKSKVTTLRRDGDEELWSKLEDKLSERAFSRAQDTETESLSSKSWFFNLFHGIRGRV